MEEGKEAIKTEEIIATESSDKVSFTGQPREENKKINTEEKPEEKKPKGPRKPLFSIWGEFYEKNYKKLIFFSNLDPKSNSAFPSDSERISHSPD